MSNYLPIAVSRTDVVFGGKAMQILPPYSDIPDEFKRGGNEWTKWQSDWFYGGLKQMPTAKEGIDLDLAMQNLACAQGSFEPKHEHKAAGVAYLASLWFKHL
ncbi:TPA: hypothetical protein L6B01_29150 [Pseudomonas aeruginosa]|nr:hypothetical protein [Pseudomonas aeruginosa]